MEMQISLSQRLDDDVVFDVLTRVPVKSLIRFRCVSKSWYSTISSSIFITAHLHRAKSSSSNNNNNRGYLLYSPFPNELNFSSYKELCTASYNSDRTLTHISRFRVPFSYDFLVSFCNGMLCLNSIRGRGNVIYLWNPSIRKFKKLLATPLTYPFHDVVVGLAYHSQNNDYKILRIVPYKESRGSEVPAIEAEIYTLSTDLWRRVVISVESFSGSGPSIGCIDDIHESFCIFYNGALHSIACCGDYNFILSFDVDDERFREILLPQNYLDGVCGQVECLTVFKGSLALIVFGKTLPEGSDLCHLWVMKEYGVAESWTKKSLPIENVAQFFGCTVNGELLIEKFNHCNILSFEPESLNEEILRIPELGCMIYTTDFVESLVLLDGVNTSSEYENQQVGVFSKALMFLKFILKSH
ncbi:hypothetical protein RGQ29_024972 [Quercus rubra]|uniref:F-box domain-containing protein n=1 Tax=Quercus rubra TaxID=3512 RepID=A0AAN7EX02_QUERU|nr:hypothetical protein RGQ29_024972 [Quercus rubra]